MKRICYALLGFAIIACFGCSRSPLKINGESQVDETLEDPEVPGRTNTLYGASNGQAVTTSACTGTWTPAHSVACNSELGNYCRALGFAGGVLQDYAVTGPTSFVCLGNADYYTNVSITLTIQAELPSFAQCTDFTQPLTPLYCESATGNVCRRVGAPAGGMLQGHDLNSDRATILCPRSGQYLTVSLSELSALISPNACSGSWGINHSQYCPSAAGRYCRARGYSGGTIQNYSESGGVADIICF